MFIVYCIKARTKYKEIGKMEEKQNEVSEDFLKEVYIQCNNIYLAFVNFRYQLFTTFISNAALFAFVYNHKTNLHLDITISVIGIIITWIMFFIDRRNRYIFKRATYMAGLIEKHFNVPENMGVHSKSDQDCTDKMSHSIIFILITVCTTVFWILYLAYCIIIY